MQLIIFVVIDMETPAVVGTTSPPSSPMLSISSFYFINLVSVWVICTVGTFFVLQGYPQPFVFFDVSQLFHLSVLKFRFR